MKPLTSLPDRPFLPEYEDQKRKNLFYLIPGPLGLALFFIGIFAINPVNVGIAFLMAFGGAGAGLLTAALIPKQKIPLTENQKKNAEMRAALDAANVEIEQKNKEAEQQLAAIKAAREEAVRRNAEEGRRRVVEAVEAE